MKSIPKVLLAVITLATATLGGTGMVAPPAANAVSNAVFANRVEASIIKYTNQQRRAHKKRVVRASACVDRYAEGWGSHLARTNRFYHRNYRQILRGCHRSYASENIARYSATLRSPDTVAKVMVRMWMRSPGHRKNLLNRKVRLIGVGVQKSRNGRSWVAVQNFTS